MKPERQQEIITVMASYKDFSITFAKAMIIKTPPPLRESRGRRRHDPWDKAAQNDLFKQLADAEQNHDFYSRLYKQYTVDLLRPAIFTRSLLTNTRIQEYLDRAPSSC